MEEEEAKIIEALSTLTSSKLSDLTHFILSLTHRHHRRLAALLSSPPIFFLTLHHLHSLSPPNKTLLIARHLLSSLQPLTGHFQHTPPHAFNSTIRQRESDTVMLLLLLCEVQQQNPEALQSPLAKWHGVLTKHFRGTLLTLSGIGTYKGAILMPYLEMVTRCRRFLSVMGGGGKAGREVAAAPATVVALPSVQVSGGGGLECVICKEEINEGRDVCKLPCEHLFHWMCILPWLRKRNTCPCCRYRLPTDDVFGEIQRQWEVLVEVSRRS
ncbi:hypothetical protein Patl1_31982 [Pistacia atlantica]|uniref:Uncharacterized protein n=1 Tax=Pistacia atlantica TaxID=434234 RepID=A0ACC1AN66_9ROSI|nr:hypothetical protein Patl1_31982 [Pistacia atlantica]